jgi:hypothetical protein
MLLAAPDMVRDLYVLARLAGEFNAALPATHRTRE